MYTLHDYHRATQCLHQALGQKELGVLLAAPVSAVKHACWSVRGCRRGDYRWSVSGSGMRGHHIPHPLKAKVSTDTFYRTQFTMMTRL